MSTEVVMPQMGESIAEGTITKWYKKPGERVERDEPLFEISTDKVDTEVPAPAGGTLEQILVQEGETVAVGTVVATVGDGAAKPALPDSAPPKQPSTPVAPPQAGADTAPKEGHFRASHEPKTFERNAKTAGPKAPAAPPAGGEARRHHLSPVVVALAGRRQLPMEELLSIPGSGRGGRITKKDVERYLENRTQAAPAPQQTTQAQQAQQAPPTTTLAAPGRASPAAPPAAYLYRPEPDDELVPMSGIRKQIAEHMIWSQQISAQVTSFTECDMHRIVRYRDEHRARFEETEGVPLTFLPFVAEATVRALKEFPIFNASVVGDQIALKKHVHLGLPSLSKRD